MKKIIILTSFLFVAVIVAAVLYFSNLNGSGQINNRTLSNTPADAVFLVSFKNDKSFYDVFKDYAPIRSVAGEDMLHDLSYLQNRLLKNQAFAPYINEDDVFLSFHPADTSVHYLLHLPMKGKIRTEEARQLLNTCLSSSLVHLNKTASYEFFTLRLPELKKVLYVSFKNGMALASFSEKLLLKAIDQNERHLSKEFIQKIATTGSQNNHSAFRLYINNGQLSSFARTFYKEKPTGFPGLLDNFSGISVLDINFKQDALMFSGISHADTGSNNYLSLYTQQQPVSQQLKRILPEETALYSIFGISDYPRFHDRLKNLLQSRKELTRINEQLRLIKSEAGISVEEELFPQWGKEFAHIELNTREKIGIISFRDSISFTDVINEISTPAGGNMFRLNHSNLLYYAFGDPLRELRRPFFMLVGNYMICANNQSTLLKFADEYTHNRLLMNTASYRNFDQLQTNQATISAYLNNRTYQKTLAQSLRPPFEKIYTDSVHYGYTGMETLAVQLSGSGENFVINLYAQYAGKENKELGPLWTFDLNGQLSTAPVVVALNDSSAMVLAGDESHILHALDADGKQRWNAQLPGPVMGNVHQLDDYSIVLTTAKKLYRFKTDGTPLPGFPVTLPREATAGASIYSSNHRDLRIYVPAGNRIFAYNGDGKVLPGWENKTVSDNLIFDLKTGLLKDVNYVVAATSQGRFYLFNYNGSLVSLIDDREKQVFHNPFGLSVVPGSTEQSKIMTTDTTGTLRYFFFDKKQQNKNMGVWSAGHFFDVCNLTGDSLQELVFLDKKQLYVYNPTDSSLVYTYTFANEITSRPVFFNVHQGRYVTGVASEQDKLLYVFEEDGSIASGLPLEGLPYFYYGNLKNDGRSYLICGRDDGKLYVFRL